MVTAMYISVAIPVKCAIKELQNRSISETLQGLPYITGVFRNKEYYDLNKVVTNELDFLLGAVLSQILNKYSMYCGNRGIMPSFTEANEFNKSIIG